MLPMPSENPGSHRIALALGSNLGNRLAALRTAITALASYVAIEKRSAVYETPPAYVADQPAYLNAAVTGATNLEPLALLYAIKQIEIDLGRKETFRYGPRLIDIDILLYDDRQLVSPELTVPHPKLIEREFVLRPLADIAADWRHPRTEYTIAQMLASLGERNARRLEDKL